MKLFQLITITLLLTLAQPGKAALVLLDRIAIIVDEDVIMQSEIDERTQAVKAQLAASPSAKAPPEEVLQKQIIERLIVESLQLQMADRAGVRISDDELNQALYSIAAQNNLTLEQFQVALEQDGVAWPEMRDQVRREIRISRVQQGIMRKRIQITEQEIKNFLASDLGESVTADEYRLGHILLSLPDNASADEIRAIRDKAEQILSSLAEGVDFKSVAIEFS